MTGFNDCTVMRDTIQERGCHLGISEDADPFAKLQVCGDDDAGRLIELADQMEEQCAARFGEWDVAQFVDNDNV